MATSLMVIDASMGAATPPAGGTSPIDLSPAEYLVSEATSRAQLLRRVFTSDFKDPSDLVRASTSTRCRLAWGSPCGREITVSSRAISPSCRVPSPLRIANRCLGGRSLDQGTQ